MTARTRARSGSWLTQADLNGDVEPTDRYQGCGCRNPLIWDSRRGRWRHLDDGSDCVTQSGGAS